MALILDGSTALILSVPPVPFPFTLSMWWKPGNIAQANAFALGLVNTTDVDRTYIKQTTTQAIHDAYNGVNNPNAAQGTFIAGQWHSIVAVALNAINHKISLNGQAFVNAVASCGPSLIRLVLGSLFRQSAGYTNFVTGRAAFVSLHAAAFSQQDAIDYAAGKHPMLLPVPAVVTPCVGDAVNIAGIGVWAEAAGSAAYDQNDNPVVAVFPPAASVGLQLPSSMDGGFQC